MASIKTCCVQADVAPQANGKNFPFSGKRRSRVKRTLICLSVFEALCDFGALSNGSEIKISYKMYNIPKALGVVRRWLSISGGAARAVILQKVWVVERLLVQNQFDSGQHLPQIIVTGKANALQFG